MPYPKFVGFDPESKITRLFNYRMWNPGNPPELRVSVFMEVKEEHIADSNVCVLRHRRWRPRSEVQPKTDWAEAGFAALSAGEAVGQDGDIITLRVDITLNRGDGDPPTGLFYAELRIQDSDPIRSDVARVVESEWEDSLLYTQFANLKPYYRNQNYVGHSHRKHPGRDDSPPWKKLKVHPNFLDGFTTIANFAGHIELPDIPLTREETALYLSNPANRRKYLSYDKHRDLWLTANYIPANPKRQIDFATEQAIVYFRVRINNKDAKGKPDRWPNRDENTRHNDTARARLELYLAKLDGPDQRPAQATKYVKIYNGANREDFADDMKLLTRGAYAVLNGNDVELVSGN